MARFSIELAEDAKADLRKLRASQRSLVISAIKIHLATAPDVEEGHKKRLRGIVPPWDQVRPVWQLSVVPFRVFYDVDVEGRRVIINAVRLKTPGKTTKDLL